MRNFLLTLCLLSLSLNIALLLRFVFTRDGWLRRAATRLSLAGFSILFTLLLLEITFSRLAISDAFLFTLASKQWMARYFHPINSLGYRDVEHSPSSLQGKRLVVVTGDSFVAGHGIRDYRDRFSNVLGRHLGSDWVVAVVAKGGLSTGEELSRVKSFPYQPDTLILSYYINDIYGAAAKMGLKLDVRPEQPSRLIRPLVESSYLANFAYWRIARGGDSLVKRPKELTARAYCDPQIWRAHASELQAFVDYARQNEIHLIVIVFPRVSAVSESQPFTSKVVRFLRDQDVRVVDMSVHLADRDPRTMVVNSLDGHPNEAVNKEVASLLYQAMQDEGIVD